MSDSIWWLLMEHIKRFQPLFFVLSSALHDIRYKLKFFFLIDCCVSHTLYVNFECCSFLSYPVSDLTSNHFSEKKAIKIVKNSYKNKHFVRKEIQSCKKMKVKWFGSKLFWKFTVLKAANFKAKISNYLDRTLRILFHFSKMIKYRWIWKRLRAEWCGDSTQTRLIFLFLWKHWMCALWVEKQISCNSFHLPGNLCNCRKFPRKIECFNNLLQLMMMIVGVY